jgi:hypothetical protein
MESEGDLDERALVSRNAEAASVGDHLYQCFPPSVDIRVTPENGRGLWAKKRFVAGKLPFLLLSRKTT